MNQIVQGLLDNARFYRRKGTKYLHKAEICDSDVYLQEAAKALAVAQSYYETAYHCAVDMYGSNTASDMLLDDVGENCKLIDKLPD